MNRSCVIAGLASFAVIIAATSVASPQEKPPPKAEKEVASAELPLFPLARGLKWELKPTGEADPSVKPIAREVKQVVVMDGNVCYEILDKGLFEYLEYYSAHDDGLYRVMSDQILHSSRRDIGIVPIPGTNIELRRKFDPPYCVLKPFEKKVQKWSWNFVETSEGASSSYKVKCKGSAVQYSDSVKYAGKEIEATVVVREIFGFHEKDMEWVASTKSEEWFLPGKGLIKSRFFNGDGRGRFIDKPSSVYETVSFTGGNSLVIGKIILNEKKIEKEGRVDIVESEVDAEATYSKTRTIRREIGYNVKIGQSKEVEAKLRAGVDFFGAELGGKIRASVEAEVGEKWTAEIAEKADYKIPLKKNSKVQVVWLDVYRTGTVEVTQEGKTYAVPFEFPIATRTIIKAVK